MNMLKNVFKDASFNKIKPCTFYLGIDPTSDKLHVGHYFLLSVCRKLTLKGFECIILIGDRTAGIGDPTGKLKTRQVLDETEINNNIYSIIEQIEKLNFDFKIKFNSALYSNPDFSLFSMNQFLKNKTFKERLEANEHLSILEFIYPCYQAYDFYKLNEYYNVKLQIGGSDQWFNMIQGKNISGNVNVATVPLLTTKGGGKIGKTDNKKEFNSFNTWQYFRNIKDDEINDIRKVLFIEEFDNINQVKIEIANDMVEFIYGKKELIEVSDEIKKKYNVNIL